MIATYGDHEWVKMARERALPSTEGQGAKEVFCLHYDQLSIARARNEAARWGNGEWLCFLDADDELAPGYLDAMERAFEREVLGGDLLLTPAVSYVRKGKVGPPQFNDRGQPLSVDNWLVVGTLIRRELFERIGGFHEAPHGWEDWGLWNKAWQAGARIVKVPGAVYRAHVNPNSKHRVGWRNRKWQVDTHNRVAAELEEWGKEYKAASLA